VVCGDIAKRFANLPDLGDDGIGNMPRELV